MNTLAASYIRMGNEKFEDGDKKGAIDDFSKSIEIEPNNHSTYYWRAMSKREMKDYSGAINDYSKAIENCTDKSYLLDYYCSRGFTKTKVNDDKGAIQDYLNAIEIAQDYFLPYTWLGQIYCKRKEYSKAVEYLDNAAKILNNEDTEFWMNEFIHQDYSDVEWDELLKFKINKTNKQ